MTSESQYITESQLREFKIYYQLTFINIISGV